MKFVPDSTNPKKVQMVSETAEEAAWISTLREGGKRIRKGSERYVLRAFREWQRAPKGVAINAEELKAAMTRGTDAPTPKNKEDEIKRLQEEARDAVYEFDGGGLIYADVTREMRGRVIRLANELHQRLYGRAMEFGDGTREDRAWEARNWLESHFDTKAPKQAPKAKACSSSTNAPREILEEVREWAMRLVLDADYRDGIASKDEVGQLTSLACRAAQIMGSPNPSLSGIPWPEKANAILDWVEEVA